MSFVIVNGLCTLSDVKAALRDDSNIDDDRLSLAIDAASRQIESACNRHFWLDPSPRSDSATTTLGDETVADTSITAADVGRSVTGAGIPANAVVGNVVVGTSFDLLQFEGIELLATVGGATTVTIGYSPRRYVSMDSWLVETDDFVGQPTVESDYAGDGTFGTTWSAQDYQLEPVNGIMEGLTGWPNTAIRAIRSLYFPVWGGIAYPRPYTQALVQVVARWGWASIPSSVVKACVVQAIALFKADDVPFGATPFGETGVLRLRTALHPTAELLIGPYQENPVLVA